MFDVEKDLAFELVGTTGKTFVYEIYNTQQGCMIRTVKWFSSWRHYCFFPVENAVFSDRCLIKIGEFVEKLNSEHKRKLSGSLSSKENKHGEGGKM